MRESARALGRRRETDVASTAYYRHFVGKESASNCLSRKRSLYVSRSVLLSRRRRLRRGSERSRNGRREAGTKRNTRRELSGSTLAPRIGRNKESRKKPRERKGGMQGCRSKKVREKREDEMTREAEKRRCERARWGKRWQAAHEWRDRGGWGKVLGSTFPKRRWRLNLTVPRVIAARAIRLFRSRPRKSPFSLNYKHWIFYQERLRRWLFHSLTIERDDWQFERRCI